MPFWIGEAPGRTDEVSTAVSDLREDIERLIREDDEGAKSETRKSKSEANPNLELGKAQD
jgi:ATP-dependent Lhr-like helicase